MKTPGFLSRAPSLFAGVIPVLPTPFTAQEDIDEDALRQLVEFAISTGSASLCLPAYGSEFYKLNEAERFRVVEIAAAQATGRAAIIAQSNHASAKVAAEFAKRNADLGADAIAFALPRIFALPEPDLLHYAERVTRAVDLPVVLQDFNPGGSTVGPEFCRELRLRCANFAAIKLEEPVMGGKVRAIREATGDELGVLEGWGGIYLTELYEYGISGLMPGTGLSDLLNRVWQNLQFDQRTEAAQVFSKVLPLISFSLQTFELYHYVEKRLLQRRGALPHAYVRDSRWTPSPEVTRYTDELIDRILEDLDQFNLPRYPEGEGRFPVGSPPAVELITS